MAADPARFWNRVAARYAKAPMRAPDAYAATLDRVRAHLTPGDRVLELGCGTGTTAVRLADAVAEITATDIADNMLEIARGRAADAGVANVTFAAADAEDVAQGAPYDVVMAFNLLHLMTDRAAALAAIARDLRPGGLLICKTICLAEPGQSVLLRLALALALPVMQALGKAPRFAKLTVAELEAEIAAVGFDIIEAGNYPERPPSRLVIARHSG
jgi:ubiquinone/menaquinone biosynthesis C-methylase UbiE